MIHAIVALSFIFIPGTCLYVILNPASYSTLVIFIAMIILLVAALAVAPSWRSFFESYNRALHRDHERLAREMNPETKALP